MFVKDNKHVQLIELALSVSLIGMNFKLCTMRFIGLSPINDMSYMNYTTTINTLGSYVHACIKK